MIRVNRYLVPKGYRAITLCPFIFVRNENDKFDKELINHERIHLRQQVETLILLFAIWYFLDFLIKLIRYRNWDKAYRNIIFEREAYNNQSNLDYLKVRGIWWFTAYFKNNSQ